MKIFAERLKDLRLEKSLNIMQLAKEMNVSHAAISRWESDIRDPNLESLVAIAKYFRVSTDFLCGLED